MAKGGKHLKQLKSERAKVKLKTKKPKNLPKGLNVIDPSFKVKKIVIKEQLKHRDEREILSQKKLNVKDLLSRLQHHNSTVRQDAVKELKQIVLEHDTQSLNSQFGSLLQGICTLSLDRERAIRRDALKVLTLILGPVSDDQLSPYCDVLISYLKCAMTHIDPYIKEDALLFLDVLLQSCTNIIARNSYRVLPSFLDMISTLNTEMKPGRMLVTTLNTKNTNVRWRIKVLERLATMFTSIIAFFKTQRIDNSTEAAKVIRVNKDTKYIPIYMSAYYQNCEIDFEQTNNFKENCIDGTFNAEEFMEYVELLMPLIFDSWTEVCPAETQTDKSVYVIHSDILDTLKTIVEIIQLIVECIDILQDRCDLNMKLWFKNNFQNTYMKSFLSKFPYDKLGIGENSVSSLRSKKRQEDFSTNQTHNNYLRHNLGICQIYIWFTSVNGEDKIMPKLHKNYCTSIIRYLNEKIENWSSVNNIALQQLMKLLRTLFLKASNVWYKNHLSLKEIVESVINACSSQSNREMELQLFPIISDVMLDHTLQELHRERAFEQFVATLPRLLLKSKIHESTIQIINKIVLRYRGWIEKELVANCNAIIENAKRAEIIGSDDEKQSRLSICNLFYFIDAQVFY